MTSAVVSCQDLTPVSILRSRSATELQATVLIFPVVFVAWRIWTEKGTVSPFELRGLFHDEEGRFGKAHFVIWLIATLLVALMILGALEEFFETMRAEQTMGGG